MHTTSHIAGESIESVRHILKTEYGWEDIDFVPPLDYYDNDGDREEQRYEQWLREMLVNEMNDREQNRVSSWKGNDDE